MASKVGVSMDAGTEDDDDDDGDGDELLDVDVDIGFGKEEGVALPYLVVG